MKNISIWFCLLPISVFAQNITFVKDSIMDAYAKSGAANAIFKSEGAAEDGVRNGFWREYIVAHDYAYTMESGKPKPITGNFLLYAEGDYKNGKRNGKWTFYSIEDKTFKKYRHKEITLEDQVGQGDFSYFFPDGSLASQGKYANNKREGIVRCFYPDGKIYGTWPYKNGKREGNTRYFYPNGALQKEVDFENGVRHGNYTSYYQNGKIEEKFVYKLGKTDGVYLFYYENGQLWTEKEYRNDLPYNVVSNFGPTGKPVDKGTLKDGNGTVKLYDREGNIYAIVTYENGVEKKRESFRKNPFER